MSQAGSNFTNQQILSWLQYYADNAGVDLEKVKILDITRKNKNLIPMVESHKAVLVLTDAGHPDIFYTMWNAGLGNCEIWYNEGSDPAGPIKHDWLAEMINRGINASAGMLILNPAARSTYKVGIDNSAFTSGSVHYVGSEIRAVIMNKLHVDAQDTLCIVSGESIAVEAAMIANEGTVIAVEYRASDRRAMEDNVHKFGLHNVEIVDNARQETLAALPTPTLAFLVASPRLEEEMASLLAVNPNIEFVIYTLELSMLSKIPALFEQYGVAHMEVTQVSVSKLNRKQIFVAQSSPWLICGLAGEQ